MLDDKQISDIDYYGKVLKILGNPLRLKILFALYTKKCKVTDLVYCLNESQPIISQQLAILRRAKIISGEKTKNMIKYKVIDSFAEDTIKKIVKQLGI